MAKYWFKRRRYGWGWMPVTPAGWLVLGAVLVIAVGGGMALRLARPTDSTPQMVYRLVVLVSVLALLVVARLKGPAPRWRWGRKPTDDPDEDF